MIRKFNGREFKNKGSRPFDPSVIQDILNDTRRWGNYRNLEQIINGIEMGYIIAVNQLDYQELLNQADAIGTEQNLKDICKLAYRDNFTFPECSPYVEIPRGWIFIFILSAFVMIFYYHPKPKECY